ncbi:retrovirus-related pol polyprotein from transposon TNT 1-94 [Tanacetum coccineum]
MNMGQDRQMQMVSENGRNQVRQCYNCRGVGHYARNCTVRPRRRDAAYLQTQLLIAQKEETGIQLQAEEFNLIAATADYEEIEEVSVNCILMANLQQASTSGTHANKALVYDSDGSVELVQQDDSNGIPVDSNMDPSGGELEHDSTNIKKTRAFYESLYNNLVIEVEKVNTLNRVTKEENVTLTAELARYKGREKSFEFNQAKSDKIENGYKKSVYQEQCLTKKLNALHLKEREKLKSDFKTRKNELLDKLIESDKIIQELDNILVKTGQSIQTIYMLLPKPDSFYHIEHKMALGYQNPFYLKQAQKKQQRVESTTRSRRPQPRRNKKNDRVPSASKSSCIKNKYVKIEEHHRNLPFFNHQKHMSSECNNIKLAIQNDKYEVICATCKKCLITANHDKHRANVKKSKKLGSNESLASSRPRKPKTRFRWLPNGRIFNLSGKLLVTNNTKAENEIFTCDNASTSNPQEPTSKRFPNTTSFLGRLSKFFYGYDDLQWGSILITHVYFVEGLGHNLFSVGQFCDSDLEVAFRRNTCYVKNLDRVDLLKGNSLTNLYTINLHEMTSSSSICLMARATSTKSWLWHQRDLYYPKNDHEDIGKLSAKRDIGFFIGYSSTSCAYRVYNRRTMMVMETMNVTFDVLSTMVLNNAVQNPSFKEGLLNTLVQDLILLMLCQ